MYEKQPVDVLEARPPAIRFAKEIVEFTNVKFKERSGMMAGLIAAITLQNILVSALLSEHEPGSESGLKLIDLLYDNAKRDTTIRWQAADLKHHFRKKGPN